ncbi:hypothetical protein T05_6618 [Trichinella murrelli]|uniref:Uncharacterized protein n=1 Tax=Trichinella murrelli TaxID=144512 RepID=A0A0V0TEA5_9BILA|nr:hypothetical protein T05_6618 [Trichinella murrelli]
MTPIVMATYTRKRRIHLGYLVCNSLPPASSTTTIYGSTGGSNRFVEKAFQRQTSAAKASLAGFVLLLIKICQIGNFAQKSL